MLRAWSLCCAFVVLPADWIASNCCNQRLIIKLQWENSEREQAHQINAQFIILTLLEVLHNKVTHKVVFMDLKHGATINVYFIYFMYWLTYYYSSCLVSSTGIWPDSRGGERAFYSLVICTWSWCRKKQLIYYIWLTTQQFLSWSCCRRMRCIMLSCPIVFLHLLPRVHVLFPECFKGCFYFVFRLFPDLLRVFAVLLLYFIVVYFSIPFRFFFDCTVKTHITLTCYMSQPECIVTRMFDNPGGHCERLYNILLVNDRLWGLWLEVCLLEVHQSTLSQGNPVTSWSSFPPSSALTPQAHLTAVHQLKIRIRCQQVLFCLHSPRGSGFARGQHSKRVNAGDMYIYLGRCHLEWNHSQCKQKAVVRKGCTYYTQTIPPPKRLWHDVNTYVLRQTYFSPLLLECVQVCIMYRVQDESDPRVSPIVLLRVFFRTNHQ